MPASIPAGAPCRTPSRTSVPESWRGRTRDTSSTDSPRTPCRTWRPATLSVPQCGQPGAPPVLTPVEESLYAGERPPYRLDPLGGSKASCRHRALRLAARPRLRRSRALYPIHARGRWSGSDCVEVTCVRRRSRIAIAYRTSRTLARSGRHGADVSRAAPARHAVESRVAAPPSLAERQLALAARKSKVRAPSSTVERARVAIRRAAIGSSMAAHGTDRAAGPSISARPFGRRSRRSVGARRRLRSASSSATSVTAMIRFDGGGPALTRSSGRHRRPRRGGLVEVGVGEHEHRVVATQLEAPARR